MPAPSSGIDWTDQAISTLRTLWSEGHPTAEIGRRMHATKNAIVGKAHRLDLPARPSPIRATSPDRAEPASHIAPPAPTPPRAPIAPVAPPPLAAPPKVVPAASIVVPAPAPTLAPEPSAARPTFLAPARRPSTCQWPVGEPGRSGFRLCGDEPEAGKPYCPSHCGRAYVRPRDPASTAATSCIRPGEQP